MPANLSPSLYVGDLQPDVNEANLYEVFQAIGPVASIRVCRDAITRRSLGYGYVNYHNLQDAERALEILNYHVIKDRPVRLMWSQRDPTLRRTAVGNIFIKNLNKSIDIRQLSDTFSVFGNILSCKIALDERGNSRGFGFIHFESKEAAAKAIAEVNGMLLADKKVFVMAFQSRRDRETTAGEKKFINVYVKELDPAVTSAQLTELFAKYGELTSCVVMTKEDGTSRGFGFACYKNPADAKAAVEALNGSTELAASGKHLFVARHQRKEERQKELRKKDEDFKAEHQQTYPGNLYVKNLDDSVDDEKLRQAFSSYGTITSCKIMRDAETGRSRGFGFVCFANVEDSTRAATEMNGRMLAHKPLYVAIHQRKELRRAHLEAQYANRARQPQNAMYPPQMFYPPGRAQGFYPMVTRPPWPRTGPYPGPQVAGGVGPNVAVPGGGPPRGAGRNGAPPKTGRPPVASMPMAAVVPSGNGPKTPGGVPSPTGVPPQPRGGAPRSGVKLVAGVRNRDQPANVANVGAGGNYPGVGSTELALNAAQFAAATPEEQKNLLGERLYPLVYNVQGDRAGKITGMLLEMDNSELLGLLESPNDLNAKISEAVAVLNAHDSAAA